MATAVSTRLGTWSSRLACPVCGGALTESVGRLTCDKCKTPFAIENGVPILLSPESKAEIESSRGTAENVRLRQQMKSGGLLPLINLIRPPHPFTFMRWRVSSAKRRAFSQLAAANSPPADAVYIDIGSGILGGANASGLSDFVKSRIVPMEIEPISGIGVVGDAHRLPWQDASIDGVLIQGVLEHVRNPAQIAAEIRRVLKPGGPVYVEIPFLQHFHLDPIDHWRWTVDGIESLFGQFELVDKGVCAGPAATLTDVLTEFPALLFRTPALYWGVKLVTGWLFSPLQLLDALWAGRPRAHMLSAALYYLGRRKAGG